MLFQRFQINNNINHNREIISQNDTKFASNFPRDIRPFNVNATMNIQQENETVNFL
jgi:hypothetical protein